MNSLGRGRFGSTTQVVRNLLIINIAIYVLSIFLWLTFQLDLHKIFGLFYFKSQSFKPYQFITHMFLHAYINPFTNRIIIFHILFNMFGLWMFGRVLENVLGSKKFFLLFFISGLGAAFIHTFVLHLQISALLNLADSFISAPSYDTFNYIVEKYINSPSQNLLNFMDNWFYQPDNPAFFNEAKSIVSSIVNIHVNENVTVGASGAVFGILAAFTVLFPNVELMLIFFPVPIKAKYLVPGYAILELFFGVANFKGDNIAHFAHLGGALFGLILVLIWKKNQFKVY
jgi:membrane associated rhomboid family serine protease